MQGSDKSFLAMLVCDSMEMLVRRLVHHYLNNYEMDSEEILYRHLRSPSDES